MDDLENTKSELERFLFKANDKTTEGYKIRRAQKALADIYYVQSRPNYNYQIHGIYDYNYHTNNYNYYSDHYQIHGKPKEDLDRLTNQVRSLKKAAYLYEKSKEDCDKYEYLDLYSDDEEYFLIKKNIEDSINTKKRAIDSLLSIQESKNKVNRNSIIFILIVLCIAFPQFGIFLAVVIVFITSFLK